MADPREFGPKVTLLPNPPQSGVTRAEALELIDRPALDKAFILAYSPYVCAFSEWNGENFTELDGIEIQNVYEFRCFGADFELRWVREGVGDKGTAVFLKEGSGNNAKEYLPLDGKYLLWGKKREGTERYDKLYEYRIGSLKIPRLENFLNGSHAELTYREYFDEDKYGNVFFFAERLLALKPQA